MLRAYSHEDQEGKIRTVRATLDCGKRSADKVHTFGFGLGRTTVELLWIPYVSAGAQCLPGLECSSSPTSGTCFPCSGACGPLLGHLRGGRRLGSCSRVRRRPMVAGGYGEVLVDYYLTACLSTPGESHPRSALNASVACVCKRTRSGRSGCSLRQRCGLNPG